MFEVPAQWVEMTREEQEAWVCEALKQMWRDMGGVLPDDPRLNTAKWSQN